MGYCCCRVFGFYVSGEAVLVFLLSLSAFSTSNYDYYYSCIASSGFDVWLEMSNTLSPVKTFFCAQLFIARGVPTLFNIFINNNLFCFTAVLPMGKAQNCNNYRHPVERAF